MGAGAYRHRIQLSEKKIVGTEETWNVLFTTWAERIVRPKRKRDEQSEESYEYIIRRRAGIQPYMQILCEGVYYDIHAVEEFEKGQLKLHCEKAKIHSFHDVCTVKRLEWIEDENGESKQQGVVIYSGIPCELVKLVNTSTNQTEQENRVDLSPVLYLETKYNIKIGDLLEITHLQDIYHANVSEFFRFHTYQTVTLTFEGEA